MAGGQFCYPAVNRSAFGEIFSALINKRAIRRCGVTIYLRGGLILVIAKLWSQDRCQTVKSCVGVLIIGTTVALAMVIIRLVGEQRLQRFLIRIIGFKHKPEAEKLTRDSLVPDNQS